MGVCRNSGTETVDVDLSNRYISIDLNGLYKRNENGNNLEGNDFNQLDSVFLSVADVVIDQWVSNVATLWYVLISTFPSFHIC